MNKTALFILFVICFAVPLRSAGQTSKVSLGISGNSRMLFVNGKEFSIKGVVGNDFPEKIRKYGGNSVRMEAVRKDPPWGAPYEQTGLEKYNCYDKKYREGIQKNRDQCLGSFVFYWSGFKQETTHTWFCMFDEKGLESPLVGLMQKLWTGQKPSNEAPILDSLTLGEYHSDEPVVLRAGTISKAKAFATDPDGDKLKYKWEVRREAVYASYAGQGEKVPEIINGLTNGEGESVILKTPVASGPYRLFVYVYDENGHFSTANLPFFVSPELKDTLNLGS